MDKDYEEWAVTAELASLELDNNEIEKLTSAAEKMRELFLTMAQADVDGLPATTHAFVSANRLRPDESAAFDNMDALVDAAPEAEDNFFLIPNVL